MNSQDRDYRHDPTETPPRLRFHFVILALLLLPLVGACGGSTPTEPTATAPATELRVTSATVSVDGVIVNDQVYVHDQTGGASTRFEAELMLGDAPAADHAVWVEYEHPGMSGMMTGRFRLYDDGTHGDEVPGDGVYCHESIAGSHGIHQPSTPHGSYNYDFYGVHSVLGSESNHMQVTVTVGD